MTGVSEKFYLSNKLPPYVFNVVNEMKRQWRAVSGRLPVVYCDF
jgi:hypothetical protein